MNDVVARIGARLVLVRLVLVGPGVARPVLGRLVLGGRQALETLPVVPVGAVADH